MKHWLCLLFTSKPTCTFTLCPPHALSWPQTVENTTCRLCLEALTLHVVSDWTNTNIDALPSPCIILTEIVGNTTCTLCLETLTLPVCSRKATTCTYPLPSPCMRLCTILTRSNWNVNLQTSPWNPDTLFLFELSNPHITSLLSMHGLASSWLKIVGNSTCTHFPWNPVSAFSFESTNPHINPLCSPHELALFWQNSWKLNLRTLL